MPLRRVGTAAETALDVPCFACGVLVAASVYRAPALARALRASATWGDARRACVGGLFSLAADAPALVAGAAAAVLSPLRGAQLAAALAGAGSSHDARAAAYAALAHAAADALALVCLVPVALTLYRVPSTYAALRAALAVGATPAPPGWGRPGGAGHRTAAVLDSAGRHAIAARAGGAVLIEAPCWLAGAVVVATGWRLRALRRALSAAEPSAPARAAACVDVFCTLLRDLPFAPPVALVALAAPWRGLPLLRALWTCPRGGEHGLVTTALGRAVIDVPAAACVVLLALTAYRLRPVRAAAARVAGDADSARVFLAWHAVAFEQAAEVAVDAGCGACLLVALAVPWRTLGVVADLRARASALSWREVAVRYALLGLVADPVGAAAAAVVVLTLWRAPRLLVDVRGRAASAAGVSALRVPWHESWHSAAFAHAAAMAHPLEAACVPAAAASLWRGPALAAALRAAGDDNGARRAAAYFHAALTAADVAAAAASALVTVALWRSRELWRELPAAHAASRRVLVTSWETLRAQLAPHRVAARHLLLTVRDVPYIAALALCALAPWRWRELRASLAAAGGFREAMGVASVGAGRALLDVPCALLCAPLLCTWRGPALARFVSSRARGGGALAPGGPTFQRFVLGTLLDVALDAPFVAIAPLAAWRLPGVVAAAWPATPTGPRAAVRAARVAVSFPPERTLTGAGVLDGHGLEFRFAGVRDAPLAFSRATLSVLGDGFWASVEGVLPVAAVRAARWTVLPLSLCPRMLAPEDVTAGGAGPVGFTVSIGTGVRGSMKVSHGALRGALESLAGAGGDAACTLLLEWRDEGGGGGGGRDWCGGQRRTGLLTQFQARPSDLLRALRGASDVVLRDDATAAGGGAGGVDLDAYALPPPPGAGAVRLMVARAVALAAADVLAAAGVALLCVALPWRGLGAARGVLLGEEGGTGLHVAVARHLGRAASGAVPDLIALALACVCPYRMPRLLRTLFGDARSAGARAARDAAVARAAKRCAQDACVAALVLVIVVTVWRLPALLRDLWATLVRGIVVTVLPQQHAAGRGRAPDRRRAAGDVVVKQALILLGDALLFLEVSYILLTLVRVPAFAARLAAMGGRAAAEGAGAWRAGAEADARRRRAAEAAAAAADAAAAASGGGARAAVRPPLSLARIMPGALPAVLFPFLDARALCAVAQVNRRWAAAAGDEALWQPLYEARFGGGGGAAGARGLAASALRHRDVPRRVAYRDAARAEAAASAAAAGAPVARDVALGVRGVIMDEFWTALVNLRHFLTLPLKAAGVAVYPLNALLRARYGNGWCRGGAVFGNPRLLRAAEGALRDATFEAMEVFFLRTLVLVPAAAFNELSLALALLQVRTAPRAATCSR